jgi:thiamine-phosphate pyrophosphorylase
LKTLDKFILCYVTDRQSLQKEAGRSREAVLAQHIENAARAGVDWIQIREKDLPTRKLMDLTHSAIRASDSTAAQRHTRVLVNDRVDVAWAAEAAGVHLGEKSLPIRVLVRAAQSSERTTFIVGSSCHSLESAMTAAEEGADYLFFGPVFATPSKSSFGAPQGIAKLAEVCAAVSIPVIAIGGITVQNARVCREVGAAGVAAIRLFQQNGDLPEVVASLTAACSSA